MLADGPSKISYNKLYINILFQTQSLSRNMHTQVPIRTNSNRQRRLVLPTNPNQSRTTRNCGTHIHHSYPPKQNKNRHPTHDWKHSHFLYAPPQRTLILHRMPKTRLATIPISKGCPQGPRNNLASIQKRDTLRLNRSKKRTQRNNRPQKRKRGHKNRNLQRTKKNLNRRRKPIRDVKKRCARTVLLCRLPNLLQEFIFDMV